MAPVVELDEDGRLTMQVPPEPVYTSPEAEGFTRQEIEQLVAEIESADYDLLENATVIVRPRGRQSLTAPGVHSPLLSTRVPPALLDLLRDQAACEGLTLSELQRKALSTYVGYSPT